MVNRFSSGLSEVVLVVKDVMQSAAFYHEVVGLTIERAADDSWAWFWTGMPHESSRLALHKGTLLFEEHSPHPVASRFGPIHFALRVPRSKLAEAVEHVRASGVEVYGPVRQDWMGADSYYFYDLDGNLLEWWSPDE